MTAKDTVLIGKKFIKKGFTRSKMNCNLYSIFRDGVIIIVEFTLVFKNHWSADITYELDLHTTIRFTGHSDADSFTVDRILKDAEKVKAVFNFLRL